MQVRRIGGDIRLIAAAEKAEYGLRVQMRLEDELESLEKQRYCSTCYQLLFACLLLSLTTRPFSSGPSNAAHKAAPWLR